MPLPRHHTAVDECHAPETWVFQKTWDTKSEQTEDREMKKVKCANCGELATPKIIREPLLFTMGMQVGGKYYKACPACLHDIESGDDRQNIDVVKATNNIADAQLKVFWYDLKETAIALIYGVGIFAAVVALICLALSAESFYLDFMYWLKGTDFYCKAQGLCGK